MNNLFFFRKTERQIVVVDGQIEDVKLQINQTTNIKLEQQRIKSNYENYKGMYNFLLQAFTSM